MRSFPLILFSLASIAVAAPFEFSAYSIAEGAPRVVITDLADHKSSGWLPIGDSFRGYTVAALDPKTESLTLKRDAESIRLFLKTASVTSAEENDHSYEKRPPTGPGIYVTRAGDTGGRIAAQNHLTLAELAALNPNVNWAKLRIGQEIRVASTK
jgi:hypothetical protein